MNNELMAVYIYRDNNHHYAEYNVYVVYDTVEAYDACDPSYYEVYDQDLVCLNEGYPLYKCPSWKDVYDMFYFPKTKGADNEPQ